MELLFAAYALVERLGLPLAVTAWVTVFVAALGLGVWLRRDTRTNAGAFLAVLALSLAAHLLDYFLTLAITPDLAQEANPIWRIALVSFGLPVAKLYGFTGKVLVSLTAAWAFVYWRTRLPALLPSLPSSFPGFVRRFGAESPRIAGVRVAPLAHLFAFLYAGLGPFFFYISLLNYVGGVREDMRLYEALPSPIPAVGAWLAALVVVYFGVGYRIARWGPADEPRRHEGHEGGREEGGSPSR